MAKFTWEEYCSEFYSWSETVAIRNLYNLTSFGDADEVYDLAISLMSEQSMNKFIRKALEYGVQFKPQHALDMHLLIEDEIFEKMVETSKPEFNREELEELYGLVSDDLYELLAEKSGIDIFDDDNEEDDEFTNDNEYSEMDDLDELDEIDEMIEIITPKRHSLLSSFLAYVTLSKLIDIMMHRNDKK